VVSRSDLLRPGLTKIGSAIVEEIAFVGAYERIRLLTLGSEACERDESEFLLTTETPERQTTKPIIATRPKPEASATRLQVGERVVVAITSFTVLEPQKNTRDTKK